MSQHTKVRNGKEIFYTKLAVYLHIFKHESRVNLGQIYGVPRSTLSVWVREFSRTRLESILKNFQMMGSEAAEGLEAGGDTSEEIRQLLMKQARTGSVAAAKMVLELEREEGKSDDPVLTVEGAIELLRQWDGPRKCSKCGFEEEFKLKGGSKLPHYTALV